MNLSLIWQMNAHCRNGLMLGIIVVAMAQLSAGTNAGRIDEPWPTLLSSAPVKVDPGIALLQQRANGSLEKLVQSARPAEQPL